MPLQQIQANRATVASTKSANNANPRGRLGGWENVSYATKQLGIAVVSGGVTALVTAIVSLTSEPNPLTATTRGGAAGVASFVTILGLGSLTAKSVQRSTEELETQLEALSRGDFQARATVYSQDELGQLADKFNQMAHHLDMGATAAKEVKEERPEFELVKDDELERQLISLLHVILRAARGDLTVRAEVTENGVSPLASSFNHTMQNLQEFVEQVKSAAWVFHDIAELETFARTQHVIATRQAEELATALNSLPRLSNAGERAIATAREVEALTEIARISLQEGSEVIEQTSIGMQNIHKLEEQTRQHIGRIGQGGGQDFFKLLELGYPIVSQTNELAQRARAEMVRVGIASPGLTIVTEELRELADDSSKALQEIEQLVLQIQGEIGAMMAVEDEAIPLTSGLSSVKQAQQALAEIFPANNRIDNLVRSLARDMREREEGANEAIGTVTQVMRSAQQTARETSQEAKAVEGTLKNLMEIAKELLGKLEHYRVRQ